MLLRELKDHDALFVPDVIVAGMRLGGVSSNPGRSLELLQEVRRAHERHLNGHSGWRWWLAWSKVRMRVLIWRLMGERNARRILDLGRMMVGHRRHWTRL